jgi:hypothetical protein
MKQSLIIMIALLGFASCTKTKCNCEYVTETNINKQGYVEDFRGYYGDDCSEDGDVLTTQSAFMWGVHATTRVRVECK